MLGLKRLAMAAGLYLGIAATCSAAGVYGTYVGPDDYTGLRTEGAGIVTGGNWSTNTRVESLEWLIVPEDGLLRYTYILNNFRQPAISHFILDLTDDVVNPNNIRVPNDPFAVFNPTLNGNPIGTNQLEYSTFGPSSGNPGFPTGQSITGIKFDTGVDGTNTFSFLSNRLPVWGDFYLKGGNTSFAYNTGLLGVNRDSMNTQFFIARPNGIIPEPGSIALVGIGAAGLGLTALRRRGRDRVEA